MVVVRPEKLDNFPIAWVIWTFLGVLHAYLDTLILQTIMIRTTREAKLKKALGPRWGTPTRLCDFLAAFGRPDSEHYHSDLGYHRTWRTREGTYNVWFDARGQVTDFSHYK